jgi:riboflavin synthase
MFTGLVEETGRVVAFKPGALGWQLVISAAHTLPGTVVGDSIAVNGCCLTVVRLDGAKMQFDLLEETRRLTNFSTLAAGDPVNLERSVRLGGKMGGHFVTGHIDGLGVISTIEARGADTYLKVRAPEGSGRYLIHKGSIAIDGISLTVAEVAGDEFAVWLIPHTLGATNLGARRPGQSVNLEFDLLGKYVEKLMQSAPTDTQRCVPP